MMIITITRLAVTSWDMFTAGKKQRVYAPVSGWGLHASAMRMQGYITHHVLQK